MEIRAISTQFKQKKLWNSIFFLLSKKEINLEFCVEPKKNLHSQKFIRHLWLYSFGIISMTVVFCLLVYATKLNELNNFPILIKSMT